MLAALALVLLGACSTDDQNVSEPSPAPSPQATEEGSGNACAEVRAGIDAFNQGDFDATVDHFRTAVPLAEAQAREDDSRRADLLLEAVQYYADLAPDDYLEASRSSADFEKYKQITLAQCAPAGEPPTQGGDPPVQA